LRTARTTGLSRSLFNPQPGREKANIKKIESKANKARPVLFSNFPKLECICALPTIQFRFRLKTQRNFTGKT
jgi:hypothetical protein